MERLVERRQVLKRIGAVGALVGGGASAVTATGEDGNSAAHTGAHTLRVEGTGPTVQFQFTVDDELVGGGQTWEESDFVARNVVKGQVSTEYDVYQFRGALEQFAVTDGSADDISVSLDGERLDVDESNTPSELVVEGTGPTVRFQFGVTGELVGGGQTWEESDFVARSKVSGQVSTQSDTYLFTGQLSRFDVTEGSAEDITVLVDGEERSVESVR